MSWLRRNMKLRPMCPDHPKRIRCISCAERLIGEKSAAESASAATAKPTIHAATAKAMSKARLCHPDIIMNAAGATHTVEIASKRTVMCEARK